MGKTPPDKRGSRAPKGRKEVTFRELETVDSAQEDADTESAPDTREEDPSEDEVSSGLPVPNYSGDPEPQALVASSVSAPLRRYLEEIRRYPLLSPEEEHRLAVRLRETGDLNTAKALVSANLRLVVRIAFEYQSIYSNILDLIQEGNVGLMKAVSKFDPSKGARLGYYSSWWIRSYILKYLLDNFRLVKIGTTQAQKKLFYHLMREKERLEAQGIFAGPKLLAEKLDVREKDVVEMEQRLSGHGAEMSLDVPVGDSEGGRSASHLDYLIDPNENPDESISRRQLLRMLKSTLPEFQKSLNEKELRILHDRLLSEEPKTLQEIADKYGLTRERARQIEARVVEKLRKHLAPKLGEDVG